MPHHLLIVLMLLATPFMVVMLLAAFAPDGYEDEQGFRHGKPPKDK